MPRDVVTTDRSKRRKKVHTLLTDGDHCPDAVIHACLADDLIALPEFHSSHPILDRRSLRLPRLDHCDTLSHEPRRSVIRVKRGLALVVASVIASCGGAGSKGTSHNPSTRRHEAAAVRLEPGFAPAAPVAMTHTPPALLAVC